MTIQLTGTVPEVLGNLTNLKRLYLFDNQLTGTIPDELGNLTNLKSLHISGNQLTGCIPNGLQDVPTNDFPSLGLGFCNGTTPAPPTDGFRSGKYGDHRGCLG